MRLADVKNLKSTDVLRGFKSVQLRVEEEVLVVRLSPAEQDRLLADDRLRLDIVRQARSLGFSRVVLELEPT